VLHINEFQTPSFVWPLLIEFRLPNRLEDGERLERPQALQADLRARCGWLAHESLRFVWLAQSRFGEEHDGANIIVSLYSWQTNTTSADRDRNMWTHFDMEREEPDYSAVHFDRSKGEQHLDSNSFDFVFTAYVDDPKGLSRIYSSPRLDLMREHSRLFLDTDSRRLAFGNVEIVKHL
jgi:hypothetical protein